MKIKRPNLRLRLSTAQWWLITLVTVFIVTALLTAYAIFLFIRAAEADVVTGDAGVIVESISKEALKETVGDFDARVIRFENIKGSYDGVSDPSL
jgi:hypothetical protein